MHARTDMRALYTHLRVYRPTNQNEYNVDYVFAFSKYMSPFRSICFSFISLFLSLSLSISFSLHTATD